MRSTTAKIGDVISGHEIKDIIQKFRPDKRHSHKGYNETRLVIECPECGHRRDFKHTTLRSGQVGPCVHGACYYKQQALEMVGKRFGKLIVERLIHRDKDKPWGWLCRCDCGNTREMITTWLNHPDTYQIVLACSSCAHTKANDHRRSDGWGRVFGMYKSGAKKRKIPFLLTKEEVVSICKRECAYCGRSANDNAGEPVERTRWGLIVSEDRNGIDRIDSKQAYTLDNCVSCCYRCNWAKSDMSESAFLDLVSRIYNHRIRERSTTSPRGRTPKRVEMEWTRDTDFGF